MTEEEMQGHKETVEKLKAGELELKVCTHCQDAIKEVVFKFKEPKKIFCPKCEAKGKKSSVMESAMMMDCVYRPSYYDEDGNYKSGGSPKTTTYYECESCGHKWSETK